MSLAWDPEDELEAAVGGEVLLRVVAVCSEGCNLAGGRVLVDDGGSRSRAVDLTSGEAGTDWRTAPISIRAPALPGLRDVAVTFQEAPGGVHPATTLTVQVTGRPHATRMTVWDVTSPAVAGEAVTLTIGARSSAGESLAGLPFEIHGQDGKVVRAGQLGETPLPGTDALYWTETSLSAPEALGAVEYGVRSTGAPAPSAHDPGSTAFSVIVVSSPEHAVTVTLTDDATGAPIAKAHARLGPHRATTDQAGVARFAVGTGSYELTVWHARFETAASIIDVSSAMSLAIKAVAALEDADDGVW